MSTHRDRESLLEVARYFGRSQEFISIKEARSHFRDAVNAADEKSVVLTSHGAPHAAIISYESYENMRSAVMRLLVDALDESWDATRERARARASEATTTTEDEMEKLVGESVDRARVRRAEKRRRDERP